LEKIGRNNIEALNDKLIEDARELVAWASWKPDTFTWLTVWIPTEGQWKHVAP
jgi:hypothetical protein